MSTFFDDVWTGLNAQPKRLYSKYFYDTAGDQLFQELMACPEYYPTRCEMEIFSKQSAQLTETIVGNLQSFDLIELGAGDATKSTHLLKALVEAGLDFTYLPIDISEHVIETLEKSLPHAVPGLKMQGLCGDYFDMLDVAKTVSNRNKVVLFMGSNIGNIPLEQTDDFLFHLRSHLMPGDLLIIGYDLRKDPQTILNAYNDKGGLTRRFNLNLLHRINTELEATFDLSAFIHFPVYDPLTGSCKSYLISTKEQTVCIGEENCITFKKDEAIFMEISQKYTVEQMNEFALRNSFKPAALFLDSNEWFADAVWQCV